jgi:hypothetical protein
VRLFTERPIAFGEAYYNTRSKDYEFGIVELRLDAKGEGQGATIPAATLTLNESGEIEVETTPLSTGPQRLMGVRQAADVGVDEGTPATEAYTAAGSRFTGTIRKVTVDLK